MAQGAKTKKTNIVVWVIIALLIVGLGGFGVTNFGGSVNSIGRVGDREIELQRYARELESQIRALSAQAGRNITLAQARAIGLDRAVLQQLVSTVAIEGEAMRLGISAGNEEVRSYILAIPAFQGIDGSFDREAYRFTVEQAGLSEQEFEQNLRDEIARTLLQGAVIRGATAPDIFVGTLFDFEGETRDFAWARLGSGALETAISEPQESDLRAYYETNQADFMLPETKRIVYAWLSPEMIVDSIDIDESSLRDLYEARINEFVKPERRLVERLVLGDAAGDAKLRLDAGDATFDEIVAERDLSLSDIDLGEVTEEDLDMAGAAVFATEEPGVVGPVGTDLGAALFRVNAILVEQETSFEDARAELIDEFAIDRARRLIANQVEAMDDLLAGGATVEELAQEMEMTIASLDWTAGSTDGIAAYEGFRLAAAEASADDFPEVAELEDGGVFAFRVDEVIDPRLQPFEDAREEIEAGWRADETAKALEAQAELLLPDLQGGTEPSRFGLVFQTETGLTRSGFVGDAPDDLVSTAFEMSEGEWRVIRGEESSFIVRLDAIALPDLQDEQIAARLSQFEAGVTQAISADILDAYAAAIENRVGIELDQSAINAVHAQFP